MFPYLFKPGSFLILAYLISAKLKLVTRKSGTSAAYIKVSTVVVLFPFNIQLTLYEFVNLLKFIV